ncbi:MAG: DUF3794 domain-containing protein [Clostridiaceae bacterium]|nr:DUF3794 domain-containing protein [Clostridiaceae bacterium]
MELVKKPVRSYRTIETREPEEMFEHSIIVPDIKPDVKTILLADAEAFVINVEKTGRMIEVSGEIQYRILYLADTPEPRIESINARYPWSFSLQKPKTEGDVGVFPRCRCQHTEVNIANGRKLVCRTVTSLICRFYEIKSDEIGREILGENVFLKTSPVNVISLKQNTNNVVKVSDILSLPSGSPAIKEILFSRVNLGNAEINYRDDDVFLEAKGTLFVLYRSDTMDESFESVVLEFPVRTSAGIDAAEDAIIFATNVLKDWELRIVEDDDGLNTRLSIAMEVEIDAQTVANEEQVFIEDAYCCDCQMNLNKSKINVITDERDFREDHVLTQRIRLDSLDDYLDEVLMVFANERNTASMINGDKLNIQGTIGANILYCTRQKQYQGFMSELPFTHSINLPDSGNWQVIQSGFTIEDVRFDIAGSDEIELSIKVKIRARACRIEELLCVDGINAVKDDNPRKAPIIVYFAQPNDTLWDVAKNYRVPISKLASDNGLEADAKLETGKRLFIMA